MKIQFKKATATLLLTLFTLGNITTPILADGDFNSGDTSADGGNVQHPNPINPGTGGVSVGKKVVETKDTGFRTINLLDVLVINNENNESYADYKIQKNKDYRVVLPEIDFADIIDSRNDDNDSFKIENVKVNSNKSTKYVNYPGKIKYLLENSILTRDIVYSASPKGSHIKKEYPGEVPYKIRYYQPDEPVSKTDFITNLLKIANIQESRWIVNRSPYGRYNQNLGFDTVEREPIETSPYQSELSSVGLDPGRSDVFVDYTKFGMYNIMASPEVVEFYLSFALQNGIVNLNDIATDKEGKQFRYIIDKTGSIIEKQGRLPNFVLKEPIRMNYKTIELSNKVVEADDKRLGNYPERFNEFNTTIMTESKTLSSRQTYPSTPPWGLSFTYQGVDSSNYNVLNRIGSFTPRTLTITKRPSILQDEKNGYKYFSKENLSLADAYVIIYKFMKTTGQEKDLSEKEVSLVNAKYKANFANLQKEQKEAAAYLTAKGIIDGDDENLYTSLNKQLNNDMMADLLYRIANKDFRNSDIAPLTSLDLEMLARGFTKANLSLSNTPTGSTNTDIIPISDANQIAKYDLNSISQKAKNYKFKDEENFIFIRLPSHLYNLTNLKLVTADNYRIKQLQVDIKEEAGRYKYFKFRIRQNTGTNYMLVGQDGLGFYTLTGINGPGFYMLEDDKNLNGSFIYEQLPLDSTKSKLPKDIIDWVNTSTGLIDPSTIKSGSNFNLFAEPAQAAPAVKEKVSSFNSTHLITYSPIEFNQLNSLKIDDRNIIDTSNPTNPTINKANLPVDYQDRLFLHKFNLNGNNRYMLVLLTDQSGATSEAETLRNRISNGISTTKETTKLPTYTAFNNTKSRPTALIYSKDLEKIPCYTHRGNIATNCIQQLSSNILVNTETGVKAYVSPSKNISVVGNNITKHDQGINMMSVDGKDFYSLDVVMELMSNSKTNLSFSGKDIRQNPSTNKYKLLPIRDIENNRLVGSTYAIGVGNSVYMSVSSLPDTVSNMFFFKNNIAGREYALLVSYEPDTGYIPKKETDNSIDNQYSTVNIQGGQYTKEKSTEELLSKTAVLNYLLTSNNTGDVSKLVGGNYKYKINVLDGYKGKSARDQLIDFIKDVSGDKPKQAEIILREMKLNNIKIPGLAENEKQKEEKKTKKYWAELGIINTSDNFTEITSYDEGSGNLFIRILNKDKNAYKAYNSLTGNNLLYDTTSKEIIFRRTHYYTNSPKGTIPLELYGQHSTTLGGAVTGSSDIKPNFGGKTLFKFPHEDISNNTTVIVGDRLGTGTIVELPIKAIDVKKSLEKYGETVNPDTQIGVENLYYLETLEAFKQAQQSFPIEKVMLNSTISFKEDSAEDRAQFFKGSTLGIAPELGDSFYSFRNFFLNQKRIEEALSIYKDTNKQMYDTKGRDVFFLFGGESIGQLDKSKIDYIAILTEKVTGKSLEEARELMAKQKDDFTSKPYIYSGKARITKTGGFRVDDVSVIDPKYTSARKDSKNIIFIKPTLVIPDGTTLVNQEGELLYAPNSFPRREEFIPITIPSYVATIELIAKPENENETQEKETPKLTTNTISFLSAISLFNPFKASPILADDSPTPDNKELVTYLSDIPESSILTVANSGIMLVKVNKPEKLGEGEVPWVKVISIPDTNTPSVNAKTFSNNDLFQEFNRIGNLPVVNTTTGQIISLKEIMREGLYRLPLEEDFKNYIDNKENLYTTISKTSSIIPIISTEDKEYYTHRYLKVKSKQGETSTPQDKFTGTSMKFSLALILPPTLTVNSLGNNTYQITGYSPVQNHRVQKYPWSTKYLKVSGETGQPLLKSLKVFDINRIDATAYKDFYTASKIGAFFTSIWPAIKALLIPIALLISLYLLSIYVISITPIIREWMLDHYYLTGVDWMSKLTFKYVTLQSIVSIKKVSIACTVIIGAALVLASGILEDLILKIINTITHFFS